MKKNIPILIIVIGLIVSGIILYPKKPKQDSLFADRLQPDVQEEVIEDILIKEDDHITGNFNAPVTIVTYSDFGCSFCKKFHTTLKQVSDNYPEQVRLVYKHFPISERTTFLSEVSECVWEQKGNEGFQQFSDLMFEGSLSYGDSFTSELLEIISLDEEQFNNCIDSGKYAQKVQENYEEGVKLGVNGTPNSFINGELIPGALPYETVKQKIEEILSKL